MSGSFRTGVVPNASVRSPFSPAEHAVPMGESNALCGVVVSAERKPFALSPFACKRCVKIFNRLTTENAG